MKQAPRVFVLSILAAMIPAVVDTAEGDKAGVEAAILDYVEGGHTARELIGLSAWRSGQYELARSFFSDISVDQETPNDLRQRGNVMLALIKARIGEPAEPSGGS